MRVPAIVIAVFAVLVSSFERSVAADGPTEAKVWKVTSFVPEGASIIGVWRVKSVVRKDSATGQTTLPFGQKPSGHLIHTAGGHASNVLIATPGKLTVDGKSENDQLQQRNNTVATFGTYQIDGDKLLFHVEESSIPSRIGRDEIFKVSVEGRTLTMVTKLNSSTDEFETSSIYERDE